MAPSALVSVSVGVSGPRPFLPYARQSIDAEDLAAVAEALRGDYLTTGPTVAKFEAE